MAAKIWCIRALDPFLVDGQHHDATQPGPVDPNDPDAYVPPVPAEYEFAEEIAAQIVASGRAVLVEKLGA